MKASQLILGRQPAWYALVLIHFLDAGHVRAAPLLGSRRQQLKRKSGFTKQAALSHPQKGTACVPNQMLPHAPYTFATTRMPSCLMSCTQGSIEHAACQLEAYRALLEKDVIASFDKAVHQKDLGTMAECAQVMTEFERGDSALMQVCRCHQKTGLCDGPDSM